VAITWGTSPASAADDDSRVQAIFQRLERASLTVCENIDDNGKSTSCGDDVSIIKSVNYDAWSRDGRITLTSKLVENSSDDELAYVVAHELSHVILGHAGSSISNELEADYWGARIMIRSGFDAHASKGVLDRMQARRILGLPFSMLTHPANSRRLLTIERAINEESQQASAPPAIGDERLTARP
jgi:predicted Zn-dependent protease